MGWEVKLGKKIYWEAPNDNIFFPVLFAFTWCFSRISWGELASVRVYTLHNVLFITCALLEVAWQDQSKVIEFCGALLNYLLECNTEYSTSSVNSSFLLFQGKKRHWFYLKAWLEQNAVFPSVSLEFAGSWIGKDQWHLLRTIWAGNKSTYGSDSVIHCKHCVFEVASGGWNLIVSGLLQLRVWGF